MKSPKFLRVTLAVLAAGAAIPLQAQVIANPGFESGLGSWQVFGDASTQAGGSAGSSQLWLTTAALLDVDDFPLAAGALNRSGVAAGQVAVPGGLEEFSGLTVGALDPDAANAVMAFEGSAVKQSFVTTDPNAVLSFDWDYGTSDPGADYAFVVIDGVLTRLGDAAQATQPGTLGNTWRSGFSTFNVTLAAAGAHEMAFGVVDVNDYVVTSTLSIDNLALTSAIPEAGGPLMALAGLALIVVVRRRV